MAGRCAAAGKGGGAKGGEGSNGGVTDMAQLFHEVTVTPLHGLAVKEGEGGPLQAERGNPRWLFARQRLFSANFFSMDMPESEKNLMVGRCQGLP
jgi:hypothetical protein